MEHPNPILQNKPNNIMLIAGIVLAFILPFAFSLLLSNVNFTYYDKLFYSRFFYWATALFLLFYALKIEHQPVFLFTESKPKAGFFLLLVLVLYLLSIVAAIISATSGLFGLHDSNAMVKKIANLLKGHQAMLFFIALTAGVTEEFIFRGYLLTRLTQLFKNEHAAVVVSALLFSAMHYKYGSLRELIFTFLIGIIFGLYYIKYCNIKVLMLTHFLIDLINMNLAQHIKLK